MSEELPADSSSSVKPQNPLLWPVRIVLFALLGVAIVALVIDQLARNSANEAFAVLNKQLGPDAELKDVTRDQVRKLIGKEPAEDADPNDHCETYTWQGGLRAQKLYVQYQPSGEGLLKDVSLNDPPAGFVE